mgnify:FL=1
MLDALRYRREMRSARRRDQRDAALYRRLAEEVIDRLDALATLEQEWQNEPAVEDLNRVAGVVYRLADEVAAELGGGR